jgi:hypothetical protein
MGTAVHGALGLDAVADDPAATVLASGRQGVNGALEAVEVVGSALGHNLKGLVVLIAANFALSHGGVLVRGF